MPDQQVNKAQIDKYRKAYGQIVAKAWKDPAFANRLKSDPKAVLKEHGVEVPANVSVKVVSSGQNELHIPLPQKPGGELDDEHLKQVAGGECASTAGTAGTAGCPVSSASTAGSTGTAG